MSRRCSHGQRMTQPLVPGCSRDRSLHERRPIRRRGRACSSGLPVEAVCPALRPRYSRQRPAGGRTTTDRRPHRAAGSSSASPVGDGRRPPRPGPRSSPGMKREDRRPSRPRSERTGGTGYLVKPGGCRALGGRDRLGSIAAQPIASRSPPTAPTAKSVSRSRDRQLRGRSWESSAGRRDRSSGAALRGSQASDHTCGKCDAPSEPRASPTGSYETCSSTTARTLRQAGRRAEAIPGT
jgi:hypothetical protein